MISKRVGGIVRAGMFPNQKFPLQYMQNDLLYFMHLSIGFIIG